MQLARSLSYLCVLCLSACGISPVSSPPGRPDTVGNVQAISSSEYQALLAALRTRLKTIAPDASIREIHVFDARGARAFFTYHGSSYTVSITKQGGVWHVGPLDAERPPVE
jgi:YD repeat-containing protein